jgi:hypothetical protein
VPQLPYFSRAAAQHAVSSVADKVKRCRHGRYWGHGYATVVFRSDGSVERVIVDPPFAMTVAGNCVAAALGRAHMPSFRGRRAYYGFLYYIALK